MTYRADPYTQRDGHRLATSNCRMGAGATGLDYDTRGRIRSSAGDLRDRQLDQVGGTDSSDLAIAWSSYGRSLRVQDGRTFDDALADLRAGRLVMLDVWHATVGGPCLSGTGRYGHTIAVAPESSDASPIDRRWLVSDPWCLPPKWVWWPERKLRDGAEEWGARVSVAGATGGPDAVRDLMRAFTPDHPATDTDTGGFADGGPILYTTTNGGDDMAIQAAGGLTSGYRIDLPPGTDVFMDANLSDRMRHLDTALTCVYIGLPIGETVEGGARAVVINSAKPYGDGTARPTVGYIAVGVAKPYGVAAPAPPDVTEALRLRDEEWREWLLAGSPGDAP